MQRVEEGEDLRSPSSLPAVWCVHLKKIQYNYLGKKKKLNNLIKVTLWNLTEWLELADYLKIAT